MAGRLVARAERAQRRSCLGAARPTMFALVMDHPSFGKYDLRSLRLISYGAMPMPPDRLRRILKEFPPHVLDMDAFGCTECNATYIAKMPEDHDLSGTEEEVQKMIAEDWYARLWRVITGREAITLQRKSKSVMRGPEAVHSRKRGSAAPIISPYEMTVEMTARILKADEYQRAVKSLKLFSQIVPSEIGEIFFRRMGNKRLPHNEQIKLDIDALVKSGKMSRTAAEKMMSVVETEPTVFDTADGKMYALAMWENGKLETYAVQKEIFDVFKSMTPQEFDNWANLAAKPGRFLSSAIVNYPLFPVWQFWKDTFFATMTTRYGFRPGYESVRGWWHAMSGHGSNFL